MAPLWSHGYLGVHALGLAWRFGTERGPAGAAQSVTLSRLTSSLHAGPHVGPRAAFHHVSRFTFSVFYRETHQLFLPSPLPGWASVTLVSTSWDVMGHRSQSRNPCLARGPPRAGCSEPLCLRGAAEDGRRWDSAPTSASPPCPEVEGRGKGLGRSCVDPPHEKWFPTKLYMRSMGSGLYRRPAECPLETEALLQRVSTEESGEISPCLTPTQ